MSAEKIPADVEKLAAKYREVWINEDEWLEVVIAAAILADRSARPAEPAPEVEVGDGLLADTGCTSLDDLRDKAAIGVSLMERIADLCKPGSRHEHWAPADDPAEIVFDLANEADELRRERDEARSYGQAVRIEQNRLESEVAHWKDRAARALQDREEAVRVAVEDERDRLYDDAQKMGSTIAADWLRYIGPAMLPADRARLRADQRAGDGGEA